MQETKPEKPCWVCLECSGESPNPWLPLPAAHCLFLSHLSEASSGDKIKPSSHLGMPTLMSQPVECISVILWSPCSWRELRPKAWVVASDRCFSKRAGSTRGGGWGPLDPLAPLYMLSSLLSRLDGRMRGGPPSLNDLEREDEKKSAKPRAPTSACPWLDGLEKVLALLTVPHPQAW